MFGLPSKTASSLKKLFDEEGELAGKGRKPAPLCWTEDGAKGYVAAVWHDASEHPGATTLRESISMDAIVYSRAGKVAARKWEALRRFAARNGVDLPEGEWLLVEVETA